MDEGTFTTTFGTEEIPVHYIKTKENAFKALIKLLKREGVFGLDTETAALPAYRHIPDAALSPHLSSVRLLQVYIDDIREAVVFDLHTINDNRIFIPFLEAKKFIAHHAIFELSVLKKLGCKKLDIECSALMSRLLIHATQPYDSKSSLEDMIKSVFGIVVLKGVQTSDWSVPDLNFEQVQYAALDAILTFRLGERLARGIKNLNLSRIYNLTRAAQAPIVDIQMSGLAVDLEAHHNLCIKWRDDLIEAENELKSITKLKDITNHTLAGYLEENLPTETLSIWPRTPKGKLKTDAHAFSDFDELDIVAPVARHQRAQILVHMFGEPLLRFLNANTGRLHASYWLGGTRTGRLSSSKPNLQQAPRESSFRRIFRAKEKCTFVCADFSQVELRAAAEISGDSTMLRAYREGVDLHTLTASRVTGKSLGDVSKPDRQFAKSLNFGLLFGLGAAKFKHYAKKGYGVTVSDSEAHRAVDEWRETYSGYREWQIQQANTCEDTLLCYTPCGKRRKLDRDDYYGSSLNTPVQGGAAEVMLYSLVELNKELDGGSSHIVNCVHDEIVVECLKEDEEVVKHKVEESMVKGFLSVFPSGITRDLVSIGSGPTWGEAKE